MKQSISEIIGPHEGLTERQRRAFVIATSDIVNEENPKDTGPAPAEDD